LRDLIIPSRLDTEVLMDSAVCSSEGTEEALGTWAEYDLNARMVLDNERAEAKGSEEFIISETTAIPSRA
jgi:hypothetical protein